jgi:hypothetical protein
MAETKQVDRESQCTPLVSLGVLRGGVTVDAQEDELLSCPGQTL